MITVGLVKGLLYYDNKVFWEEFFKYLNIKTITNTKTTKETIEKGKLKLNDEACLSTKIFLGLIEEIKDKCDYILIPRVATLKKHEKMCTNFYALYDVVKNVYKEVKFLDYNVDIKFNVTEFSSFMKLSKELNIPKKKIKEAFIRAKERQKIHDLNEILRQEQLLKRNNKKILLVGHSYNTHDNFISKDITDYLNKENITTIYADIYKLDIDDYKKISKDLYWTTSIYLLNAIVHYKNKVNGIILLSTFPCGVDSLVNELIIRKTNLPTLHITIDELSSANGLETRLESFIDIIKERSSVR